MIKLRLPLADSRSSSVPVLPPISQIPNDVITLCFLGDSNIFECCETGILNALSLANYDSNVIVLTDASPKDVENKSAVISRALELRNSIHFLLSRDCGNVTPYLDVAKETFGVVVHHISDFEAFVEFADKVGEFNTAPLYQSKERKRQASEDYCAVSADISTSVFTESIDIFFSSISDGSVITIFNPIGNVNKITPNGNTATYNTSSPIGGTYKICSNKIMNISVSNPSDLEFLVKYDDVNVSSASLPSPGKLCHTDLYM